MGTSEKLGVNIHVDQLMDTIASNCMNLERLELRYRDEIFLMKFTLIIVIRTDGIQKIYVSLIKVKRQSIYYV